MTLIQLIHDNNHLWRCHSLKNAWSLISVWAKAQLRYRIIEKPYSLAQTQLASGGNIRV